MTRLLPSHIRPIATDDLLYGAEAIREFLNLRNVKQVYRLRETAVRKKIDKPAPIFEIPGIGLAARKTALSEYLIGLEQQAVDQKQAGR